MRGIFEGMDKFKTVIVLVIVQLLYVGIGILYKLVVFDGMSLLVIIAYRFVFATAFMAPLAFIFESVIGGLLMVGGLYMVLWGKGKETKKKDLLASSKTLHVSSSPSVEIIVNSSNVVDRDHQGSSENENQAIPDDFDFQQLC